MLDVQQLLHTIPYNFMPDRTALLYDTIPYHVMRFYAILFFAFKSHMILQIISYQQKDICIAVEYPAILHHHHNRKEKTLHKLRDWKAKRKFDAMYSNCTPKRKHYHYHHKHHQKTTTLKEVVHGIVLSSALGPALESIVEPRKKPSYFPLNPGWLIGILIMVYYNALYNWIV